MSLSKLILFSVVSILIFSGCQDNINSNSNTTLGKATSTINSDSNATMLPAPPTLKSIHTNIAKIIDMEVTEENQKDATSFTKEFRYCDISGVKEFEHQGDLQNIKKLERFDVCKTTDSIQNGHLTLNYKDVDSEGKFPQIVTIRVDEDYTFNDILLQKGTTINSHIVYSNNMAISSISLDINGTITYQYGTYRLIDSKDTILF